MSVNGLFSPIASVLPVIDAACLSVTFDSDYSHGSERANSKKHARDVHVVAARAFYACYLADSRSLQSLAGRE